MARMIEIKYSSNLKELEKLEARLERAEKAYQKKLENAQKYGVAEMTDEEHQEWLKTVPTTEGWITDKKAVKKNGAWLDLIGAKMEVEDIKRQISNAEKRFETVQEKVLAYRREIASIEDLKAKEELRKKEFEQEQKEWAKDGITLEERYYGKTPKGKPFWIEDNHGYTERSFHCVSLTIGGEMIFTSGEFWRAYKVIKNS